MLREVPNPKGTNTLSQVRFRLSDKIQQTTRCGATALTLVKEKFCYKISLSGGIE